MKSRELFFSLKLLVGFKVRSETHYSETAGNVETTWNVPNPWLFLLLRPRNSLCLEAAFIH